MSDDDGTSDLFKAVSVRFEKYFNFGKIGKPTEAETKDLGIADSDVQIPSLYVMVSVDGSIETISAIKFDESRFGAMNYTNVMQFLFAINSQYRHFLPGNNFASRQQEAEMADILKIEEKRFDIRFPKASGNHSKKQVAETIKLTPTVTKHVVKEEL